MSSSSFWPIRCNGLFQPPPRRSGVASLLNAFPSMVTQRRKDGSLFAKNGPSLGGELGPFRFGRLGGGERTRLFQGARQALVPATARPISFRCVGNRTATSAVRDRCTYSFGAGRERSWPRLKRYA
jgi:hypothetical protein